MSLTDTNRHASYTANGSTTEFSFPHKFLANAHLQVYDAGTLQTITTDYTVTGAGEESGGTVTFTTAPTDGNTVLILRVTPNTQPTDWVANARFNSQDLEDDLDRRAMIVIDNYPTMSSNAGTPEASVTGFADRGDFCYDSTNNILYHKSSGNGTDTGWEALTDVTALGDIGDVIVTSIASGEILKWNGSAWVNNTLAEAGIAAASHSHATSDITSGTFADARIAESNVTQHEAALTITESQVSDLGSYITASSADTLTNKTIDANGTGNSISNIETADLASAAKTGSDTAVVTGTAGNPGDLAQWNADGDLVDGPTPPSGTIVGTTDTQTLTNKTMTIDQLDAGTPLAEVLIKSNASGTVSTFSGEAYGTVSLDSFGTAVTTLKNNLAASAAPTVNDDSIVAYSVGSRWLDTTNDKEYVCLDSSGGAAVWKETTGGSAVSSVFGRTGAVVAAASDYDASQVDNDSAVAGVTVAAALDQLNTDLAAKAAASHNHAAGEITSGTFADARIAESNVTQHEAALDIDTTQLSVAPFTAASFLKISGSSVVPYASSHAYATFHMDLAGTGVVELKNYYGASSAPTVNDDGFNGYGVGSYWYDTTNDKAYVCLDDTTAAAVWKETTASGGGGGGGSLPVDDTTAVVQDPVDNTKQARIDAGAITTGTTRVITMGDRDVDLASGGTFAENSHTHAASDINSGTLAHERGGLEADVSAYSGLVKVNAGVTSQVTDNSTNWNTAYSWGDHSSAGYLTDVVSDTTPQLGGNLGLNAKLIADSNGNEMIGFTETASAVNYLHITNAVTASGPLLSAAGDNLNVDLRVSGKGTGSVSSSSNIELNTNDLTGVGDVACSTVTANSHIDSATGNISAANGDVTASTFTFSSPVGSASVVTTDSSGIMGENYVLTGGVMATDVVSGSAGTSGNLVKWDANGEAVDASIVAADVKTTRTGVYRTLWVPASAMVPRTSSGAATGTVELVTNDVMLDTMDFDTTTEEGVGFWVNFGDQWGAGTVKVKFYWTAASGTGTVKWDIAGQSYADSDAIDQALGTEQGVTDTLITANDMHITSATSALTIADATAGEPVYLQITRDVATDTLGVDAQLIGCMIQYQESSTEQSAW